MHLARSAMGQLVFSEPSSSAGPSSVADARQEALRKAGAEYFEKVLEQARKGQNVLNEAPRPRQASKDVEAQDEDLEAVGQAIPYAVGVLHFAAISARLVLLKVHGCNFLPQVFDDYKRQRYPHWSITS